MKSDIVFATVNCRIYWTLLILWWYPIKLVISIEIEKIMTFSLVPTFELYPKSNQGIFDKFSWQWDRHLPLNLPQVLIHIHSSLDYSKQNYELSIDLLFLIVVFPWSKFRQAKICVWNQIKMDHSKEPHCSTPFLYWARRPIQCPFNSYKIVKKVN